MSIYSKILLQINAKLIWTSCKAEMNKDIKERNLMVIGVDSSRIKGRGVGVAMLASLNNTYTDLFNKEEIIPEKDKDKEQRRLSLSQFIQEAIIESSIRKITNF